jgi:hypothetical protein
MRLRIQLLIHAYGKKSYQCHNNLKNMFSLLIDALIEKCIEYRQWGYQVKGKLTIIY